MLRLPGSSSLATIADTIAELVGEAHAERAERCSVVVNLGLAGCRSCGP